MDPPPAVLKYPDCNIWLMLEYQFGQVFFTENMHPDLPGTMALTAVTKIKYLLMDTCLDTHLILKWYDLYIVGQ